MHYNQNDHEANPNPKPKGKTPKLLVSTNPAIPLDRDEVYERDYDQEYDDWLDRQVNCFDDPAFYVWCTR